MVLGAVGRLLVISSCPRPRPRIPRRPRRRRLSSRGRGLHPLRVAGRLVRRLTLRRSAGRRCGLGSVLSAEHAGRQQEQACSGEMEPVGRRLGSQCHHPGSSARCSHPARSKIRSIGQKSGAGSRSKQLCLLLKTILPVNSRKCADDCGNFAPTGGVASSGRPFSILDNGCLRPPNQCRKCRTPVNTMARPSRSAAATTSSSRTEPPG